jgi:hypothetical protein
VPLRERFTAGRPPGLPTCRLAGLPIQWRLAEQIADQSLQDGEALLQLLEPLVRVHRRSRGGGLFVGFSQE